MTERILAALGRLEEIPSETAVPEPFRDYFTGTARFLLTVKRGADVRELYSGILPENYASSYANPDYAVRMLGDGYGQLLSAVGYAHAGKNGGNEGENTEEAAEEPAEEAAAADETPVHNEEN